MRHVLEKESEGEFSYPCLIESKPGTLAVTYTWNRRRIAFREYAQRFAVTCHRLK